MLLGFRQEFHVVQSRKCICLTVVVVLILLLLICMCEGLLVGADQKGRWGWLLCSGQEMTADECIMS